MEAVNIRVVVDPDRVGAPGPETVLLERLMKDHAFVRSAVILRESGFVRNHLTPDEATRRNK